MAYDIQQLLRMTQSQLDELFTASVAGVGARALTDGQFTYRSAT